MIYLLYIPHTVKSNSLLFHDCNVCDYYSVHAWKARGEEARKLHPPLPHPEKKVFSTVIFTKLNHRKKANTFYRRNCSKWRPPNRDMVRLRDAHLKPNHRAKAKSVHAQLFALRSRFSSNDLLFFLFRYARRLVHRSSPLLQLIRDTYFKQNEKDN